MPGSIILGSMLEGSKVVIVMHNHRGCLCNCVVVIIKHIHSGISRIIARLKCSASGQYYSNRQVLLCDLASGHVDPLELSAATNETLARRRSGGAARCVGPSMLHLAREEHVANVFMVRYLAWLCSG